MATLRHFIAGKSPASSKKGYFLNDYISNYKIRLVKLKLLPLMYTYELSDILFFLIKVDKIS